MRLLCVNAKNRLSALHEDIFIPHVEVCLWFIGIFSPLYSLH